MRSLARAVLMLAAAAMPAMAQAKPVVAVLYFDNNSIGKDRADWDGMGKGIADLLTTDMASNPNLTLVERDRVQAILVEQNLTKEKTIDPQTAIRIGKLIGAQYLVYGGFMSDGRGNYILTSHATSLETGKITNPVKITTKGDDVLGMIADLSQKVQAEIRKLPALQVGQSGVPAAEQKTELAQKTEPKPEMKADQKPEMKADVKAEPKQVAMAEPKSEQKAAKASKPAGKMDMRTAMLYSKALEEEDAGNRTKAVELYKQVVAKFPLPAAQEKITKLSRS